MTQPLGLWRSVSGRAAHGLYALCGCAAAGLPLAPALAAGPSPGFTPTQIAPQPDRDAGLRAFAQLEKVLKHPRCLNCHVPGDTPLQGNQAVVHYPPIQRGVDGRGQAPLQCTVCHSTQNSTLPHAPPGLETDGKPGWHMPPASMKMSWVGLSGPALCQVVRDPKTNGGRSLAAIEEHMLTDHLVAWGWNPGPGRDLPPLDKPGFDEQTRQWIRNGAPCDASGPLMKSVGSTRAQAAASGQQRQAAADSALAEQLRSLADTPYATR
ncbi:MAG TPA: hypothetical protein VLA16_10050 [Ideonella sp.]|nr:hypothetical protein [Ideonella sp.]